MFIVNLQPNDSWAVHNIAHVYEMTSRLSKGIEFLNDTEATWMQSEGLSPHILWHKGLYYIETNQREQVQEVLAKLYRRLEEKNGQIFDLMDTTSLMFRCEMADEKIDADQWNQIVKYWQPHISDAGSFVFNDIHMLIGVCGAQRKDLCNEVLKNINKYPAQFSSNCTQTQAQITGQVGIPLTNAIMKYYEKDYITVVNELIGIKDKIVNIGGSHAQRELFDQLLLSASMKIPNNQLTNQVN